MKKTILSTFSLVLFGTVIIFSQTVNDFPLKDIKAEYVQIVGTSKFMSNKVTIEIDFGQHDKYWNATDTQIKDENGKKVVFNSMIDALNFLNGHGYEFVTAYAFATSNQNVYHYMMKKKKID